MTRDGRVFLPYWATSRDGGEADRPTAGPPQRITAEDGAQAWLFTRFEDVRAVLADSRFSADPGAPGYPCGPGHRGASTSGSLIRLDGARHQRIRRRLAAQFSLARVAEYEPLVAQAAAEAVAGLLAQGPGADFVETVGKPVAVGIAAGLLGIPTQLRAQFTEEVRHLHDPTFPAHLREQADRALVARLAALVAQRRDHPTDDLIGRLAREEPHEPDAPNEPDGPDGPEQTVRDIRLILAASVQTTSSMISLSALSLLRRDPRQRDFLADPEHLAAVVEEALRYWSVVQTGPRRVAREPVHVGDLRLKAGDGAIVSLPAANRDPAAFDGDPETVDLDLRCPRRRHLAFGYGPHQCLGQNFARMVLHGVLKTVITLLPNLRLAADPDSLSFTDHAVIYGVERLPLTW
jgi:cytochrome P450 monooxygenase